MATNVLQSQQYKFGVKILDWQKFASDIQEVQPASFFALFTDRTNV